MAFTKKVNKDFATSIKERFEKIEDLCNTQKVGTNAAILRLQSVVRELIEVNKEQQKLIEAISDQII